MFGPDKASAKIFESCSMAYLTSKNVNFVRIVNLAFRKCNFTYYLPQLVIMKFSLSSHPVSRPTSTILASYTIALSAINIS